MNKKLLVTGILLSTLAFGATSTTAVATKKENVATTSAAVQVVKKEVKKDNKKAVKKAVKVEVKKDVKKATK